MGLGPLAWGAVSGGEVLADLVTERDGEQSIFGASPPPCCVGTFAPQLCRVEGLGGAGGASCAPVGLELGW